MSSNPLDIGLGIEKGDIIKLTFNNYGSSNYTNIQFPKFISVTEEFSGMYDLDHPDKQPSINITGTIDLPSFASFLTKHKVWIKRFWFKVESVGASKTVLETLQTPIKLMHEGITGHGSYTVKRFILDPYQKQSSIVVVNTPFLLDQHNFIQGAFYKFSTVSYWFEIDKVI